jgi:hypothetical protein
MCTAAYICVQLASHLLPVVHREAGRDALHVLHRGGI